MYEREAAANNPGIVSETNSTHEMCVQSDGRNYNGRKGALRSKKTDAGKKRKKKDGRLSSVKPER